MKILTFCLGIIILLVLFTFQDAFSKPVYNKMSNVWEEDSYGRMVSKLLIIAMLIIAFIMGAIMS
jgi:uncharacterized membrane protein YqhA